MSSSVIRGKYVITRVGPTDVQILEDAGVYQRDGQIVEIADAENLLRKHQPESVVGSPEDLVFPGLVNSHHHVGLTPLQLGAPDYPLELWIPARLSARNVDPYLDTLYSAFEMIESGVTTVQHMQGAVRMTSPRDAVERADTVIAAYQAIGLRVSYCQMMRDQNRLVYEADEAFVNRLPPSLASQVGEHLAKQQISVQDQLSVFEHLYSKYAAKELVRIQLAPANLHWCSDEALERFREYSIKFQVPIHMHLLETCFQKTYARRRVSVSAVGHLHELGLTGRSLTLGHGVWLTDAEIDLIAQTETRICHNASSNLRLRSGIAPLRAFQKRNIVVGLGIDEAGLNDDRDMLQELRLVLGLHRVPGHGSDVPSCSQVLRMGTEGGAETTGFSKRIGVLEPGRAADLVVVNWSRLAYPYLDSQLPVIEGLIHRVKPAHVDSVVIAGEPVLLAGKFTRVDKNAVLADLARSLRVPLTVEEERRRTLSRDLFNHVEEFYRTLYTEDLMERPFYHMNSKE